MSYRDSEKPPSPLVPAENRTLAEPPDEPPVVARMVIEIRSDGSRTVARGALEDVISGQKVAIEAKGSSPASLAGSLMKSLLTMPVLARGTIRALLRGRKGP